MTQSKTHPCKVIAIVGGSGSGKTTFAQLLQQGLGLKTCSILSQDHYYIDQSAKFRENAESVNFDQPQALDFPLLESHLKSLRQGNPVQIPIYDFVTHKRLDQTEYFPSVPVILLDGTLILTQEKLLAQIDVSIFIDTPETIRFTRRLHRDRVERGRTQEEVLKQFSKQVKPMHDEYVEPSKINADHVISGIEMFEPRMKEWIRVLSEIK